MYSGINIFTIIMHMFNDKPVIDLYHLLYKYCVFYYYRKSALNSCWCIFLVLQIHGIIMMLACSCVYVRNLYSCIQCMKVWKFFVWNNQSSVSSSTSLARWASAHFSAFSLPRTALWWTPAFSGSYGSPILSTWSTAGTRHPWGPTSITCKQTVHNMHI